MKIRTVIDTTIDYYFSKRNERQMMQALLYRLVLNMTPKEVGKELKLSIPQVNTLTRSIDYKRIECTTFNKAYLTTRNNVERFAVLKINKRHYKSVDGVRRRLEVKRNILIVKESKL